MDKEEFAEKNKGVVPLYAEGDDFVFARPMTLDEGRDVCEGVIRKRDRDYLSVEGLEEFFDFQEGVGIRGSNIKFLALINRVLREEEFVGRLSGEYWTPGFKEYKILDEQERLSNGVWRDMGLAVHDLNEPNKKLAGALLVDMESGQYESPVLVPSRAVDLDKKGDVVYSDYRSGVVFGEEAQEILRNDFRWVRDSGVRRLGRIRDGGWGAYWDDLLSSYEDARVDWICAEGTRENLEHAIGEGLLKKYDAKAEELREQLNLLEEEREKEFESRTSMLKS